MKRINQFLALAMALGLVLAINACGDDKQPATDTQINAVENIEQDTQMAVTAAINAAISELTSGLTVDVQSGTLVCEGNVCTFTNWETAGGAIIDGTITGNESNESLSFDLTITYTDGCTVYVQGTAADTSNDIHWWTEGCPVAADCRIDSQDCTTCTITEDGQSYAYDECAPADHDDGDGDDGDGDGGATDVSDYNCSGADDDSCDEIICQMQTANENLAMACDSGGLSGDMQSWCDSVEACFSNFVTCFTGKCPPGSSVYDVDESAQECSTAYDNCIQAAGTPPISY